MLRGKICGANMTAEEIDKKLAVLRERWKKEVKNRPIITAQAKLLQLALEMKIKSAGGIQSKLGG